MKTIVRLAAATLLIGVVTIAHAQFANAAYPPVGVPGAPTVQIGATESFSWTGAEPDTTYSGEVHSTPLSIGTTKSDATGNLSVSFSTAGLEIGSHSITETAPDGSTLTGSFSVVGGLSTATGSSSAPSSGGSGGLAFTGAKVGALIAIALLLLAIGFVALRGGRQRRSSQT